MNVKNLKEKVEEFTETTSAHGCGQIPTAKFKLTKLLWGLLFLGLFSFATISSGYLIARFFQFPTKDVVSVGFGDIEFPAVTFCSLQPIPTTGLIKLSHDPLAAGVSVAEISFTMMNFKDFLVRNPNIGALADWYARHTVRFQSDQFIFENGWEMNTRELQHDLQSFKLLCKFKGKTCNDTSFILHNDGNLHNCFTFNGVGAELPDAMILRANPASGLSLTLFMDVYTRARDLSMYTIYNEDSPISGQSGARIIIHSPRTRPMTFERGFDIPTGFSTSVALKLTKRELMAEPHGNCTMDEFNPGTNYTYSTDTCYEQCLQTVLIEECGCISSLLAPPSGELSDLQYCGTVNITNMIAVMTNNNDITQAIAERELEILDCENAVMTSFGDPEIMGTCGCKEPCHSNNYIKTISQAVWPNDKVEKLFISNLKDLHPMHRAAMLFDGLNESEIIESNMIRKNFLRLNIYFETLQVETTSQVEDYPASTLISEIGGNMGFYVGISIITLMELFILVGAVISIFFKDLFVNCGILKETKVSQVNVQAIDEPNHDFMDTQKEKY